MDFSAIVDLLLEYRYIVLLPLAIVEGPVLAFATGTLTGLGYFHPLLALGILVVGDLIPDAFFYALGRYGSRSERLRRIQLRFGITDEKIEQNRDIWARNPATAMLVTKFAYGISAVFLFLGGALRIHPRIFFGYSVTISVIHYGIVMLAGYFLGSALATASDMLVAIEVAIAVAALVFVAYYVVTRFIRKRVP